MGLPLRYDKNSYEWCLDYKQMTKRYSTPIGLREWIKEEMMAYLDWSNAEDARIDAQIVADISLLGSRRRGMGAIWDMVSKDTEEQEAFYSRKE